MCNGAGYLHRDEKPLVMLNQMGVSFVNQEGPYNQKTDVIQIGLLECPYRLVGFR